MPHPHYLARKAERDGDIVRPDVCEICSGGTKPKLVKHHPDYSKPLKVQWLCPSCHIKLHKSNDSPKDPFRKRKPIIVNERTHEIIRREAFSQSLESTVEIGDVSMGDVVAKMAERTQLLRKFKHLPTT